MPAPMQVPVIKKTAPVTDLSLSSSSKKESFMSFIVLSYFGVFFNYIGLNLKGNEEKNCYFKGFPRYDKQGALIMCLIQ